MHCLRPISMRVSVALPYRQSCHSPGRATERLGAHQFHHLISVKRVWLIGNSNPTAPSRRLQRTRPSDSSAADGGSGDSARNAWAHCGRSRKPSSSAAVALHRCSRSARCRRPLRLEARSRPAWNRDGSACAAATGDRSTRRWLPRRRSCQRSPRRLRDPATCRRCGCWTRGRPGRVAVSYSLCWCCRWGLGRLRQGLSPVLPQPVRWRRLEL